MLIVYDLRQARVRLGVQQPKELLSDRSSLLRFGVSDLSQGPGIQEDYASHLRGLWEGFAVRWPPGVDLLLELLPRDLAPVAGLLFSRPLLKQPASLCDYGGSVPLVFSLVRS